MFIFNESVYCILSQFFFQNIWKWKMKKKSMHVKLYPSQQISKFICAQNSNQITTWQCIWNCITHIMSFRLWNSDLTQKQNYKLISITYISLNSLLQCIIYLLSKLTQTSILTSIPRLQWELEVVFGADNALGPYHTTGSRQRAPG